jgi:hypothetical protein
MRGLPVENDVARTSARHDAHERNNLVAGVAQTAIRPKSPYQFRRPFVVDSSKFVRAFGRLEPTPHREAVEQTVAWFRFR